MNIAGNSSEYQRIFTGNPGNSTERKFLGSSINFHNLAIIGRVCPIAPSGHEKKFSAMLS